MKKSFKIVLFSLIATFVLAVSAMAVSVDYRIEEVGKNNAYNVIFNLKAEAPVTTFSTTITFNNELFTPAHRKLFTAVDLSNAANAKLPVLAIEDDTVLESYTCQVAQWKINDNKTTVEVALTSDISDSFPHKNFDVASVAFILPEGKTAADIKADDFKIDVVYVGCGSNEYAYNDPSIKNPLTFTNNVVPSTTAKITVPAGSSVVFQDYTQAAYEAETEVDVDITTDGFVVVNTGYTAQTVYQVANGSIAKVGNFEDGLLGSANTDIRADSKYQGIRFHSFITDIARTEADDNKIVEYGYVVTAESKKNALSANYELNMSMVDAGKAFKGVAFDAKTNIVFKKNDDNTEFTGLVVGIPMTKDGLNTVIAARPYYKTQSGKYVYGKMTRKTVAETAKAIKAEGGETYNNNKDYIDKILSTVAEDFTEISIDVSELYAE